MIFVILKLWGDGQKGCVTADLHKELHGVVGVVFRAVVVLLQDVEQAEFLAVIILQKLFALLHPHGFVDEAEKSLVRLTQLQLLQHAADHVLKVHFLAQMQKTHMRKITATLVDTFDTYKLTSFD